MNLQDNPFYLIPHYPDFSRMQPEHVEPALRARLAEARQAVEALEHTATPTWSGFMEPLFRACEPVSEIWAFVAHMHSVMNNPAWREAHDRMQPEVVAFSLRVGQSAPLYRIALALRAADEAAPLLTNPRRRILKSAIRSAEHAGVGLEGAARERFNAIQLELAQRGSSYGNHVLDAIKSYSLWIRDPADIAGLPASLLCAAAQAAREAGEPGATEQKGPWRITLDVASSIPFLKHSRNRELRETLFRANATKASSGALDNSAHVEKILALRREMAVLLGFSSYADLSLSSKMAPSVAAVSQLSDNLAEAARPMARRERDELLAFAKSQGFADAELAPWDIVFWAERLRETRFNYSEEELRAYFQFPRVLEGLFGLAERLFGIRVEAADGKAPVWHPDVRFFEVYDGTTHHVLASFFLDPYCRPATKQSGAWMNPFRTRDQRPDGSLCQPIVVLVCNQTPPAQDAPSLMRFDEVTTLFHEFGHALQHMLTTVDDPEASGINNIEWDAVEIASQFMENWCYDRTTLRDLSCHVETRASLPDALVDKLLAARTYRAASHVLRQLFLGATDMDLHARYPQPRWNNPNDVAREAADRLLPIPLLPEDRLLCSFSHLFAGGYAAAYYSYIWSEVLSADAFGAFEEAGLEKAEAVRNTGRRYRATILAQGGGMHPMDVFKEFRGRAPTVDALLRHIGLSA